MRQHSSIDGRVCCVAITEKGAEAITKIVEHYTHYVGEILKDVDSNAVDNR